MKKVHLSHEIHCSPAAFWRLYFDPEFTASLVRDAIKVDDFKILKFEESEREIHRLTTGRPRINAPAAIQKVIGDNFSYTEEVWFDRTSETLRWQIRLSTFTEKTRNEGTLRVESLGPDRIRRIADAEVEARIFGMGGLMESGMEKQMQEGWNAGAAFTNKWLAEHPAT
jgi:hypothetical protein